ncbi:MAG: SHOCT domain-containing protein [Ferruginibacter sp.]
MKKIFFALLITPLFTAAQKHVPRFENDTLYTTGGYKIYKGQVLQFGKGTGKNGKFRFINIKSDISSRSLTDNSIVVKQISHFGVSALGNGYILVEGSVIFKDGSKGYVVLHMAFDKAIGDSPDQPGELIAPAQFRIKKNDSVADEINKLNKLYQDSIISKEEFESQKKKLLE